MIYFDYANLTNILPLDVKILKKINLTVLKENRTSKWKFTLRGFLTRPIDYVLKMSKERLKKLLEWLSNYSQVFHVKTHQYILTFTDVNTESKF